MKRPVIDEKFLELLLSKWEPVAAPQPPTYRLAKCWRCARKLRFGMWHIFFRGGQREAHLCGACGSLFARNETDKTCFKKFLGGYLVRHSHYGGPLWQGFVWAFHFGGRHYRTGFIIYGRSWHGHEQSRRWPEWVPSGL